MKLSIVERLWLSDMLGGVEGDVLYLRIVRDLRSKLALSEAEIKEWEVRMPTPGHYEWDGEKVREIEVEVGEAATKVIADRLKTLDGQKKLREVHLPLYEKFVE
jgi:23S rRNA maturation-related 3'-5' exoribonuclease YhaM